MDGLNPAPHVATDPRLASVLRRLELDVSRRLDGLLHGDHRGLVPGHGSEPGEARVYLDGDDVRQIDWNVTARMGSTHVRETIADRELETWLVVDRSASLEFGTADRTKADLALAAAAAVGILTARGGNRLGAMISGPAGLDTVPALQGRRHSLGILARIAGAPGVDSANPMDLGATLRACNGVARRRGLVVVLSDFLEDPDSWRHQLGALVTRHEVLAVEVVDPRELELPPVGIVGLVDTETGRVREINTSNPALRRRYAEAAAEQRNRIAQTILGAGADHLRLRTDEDWLGRMAQHLTARRRRRANTNVGARR